MSFQSEILSQDRTAVRPKDVQDLLLIPVADDPTSCGETWRGQWVAENGTKKRFYVGGLDWFLTEARLTVDQLVNYKNDAVAEAKLCKWADIPGSPALARREMRKHWESIAKPQFYAAKKSEALLFAKCSLLLLTCEIALWDQINRKNSNLSGEVPISDEITTGEVIYRHMAIVPACWNVNAFNEKYIEKQSEIRSDFKSKLAESCGQDEEVIDDLASGNTVCYPTAKDIWTYCSNPENASEGVKEIRVTEGKKKLGSLKASESESPRPPIDGLE